MNALSPSNFHAESVPMQIVTAAGSAARVSGLTHNFYRYPARFSPEFARATIEHYTRPGDLVFDPFVGGGTTLVEAQDLGRDAVGFDISSLATFISQVKITPLTESELDRLRCWFRKVVEGLKIDATVVDDSEWAGSGYLRNLDCSTTWRHRKLIELFLLRVRELPDGPMADFARCVLLRTAQSQLDGRKTLKSIKHFREALASNFAIMADSIQELRQRMGARSYKPAVSIYHDNAANIDKALQAKIRAPKLVLTSPPYPGVHILYHRWQVRGGRETPAPYLIANRKDGHGAAYYSLGDRKEDGLETYFRKIEQVFSSVAKIADTETIFVQMLAFSQPEWQLPKYLSAMEKAGLVEIGNTNSHERVWRSVPNRKWYAQFRPNQSSSQEVVLFHRLR